MQIFRFSIAMHAALSAHLANEFSTATLTLRNGEKLRLIRINAFRRDHITGEVFGAEACAFNPSEVVAIEMAIFDQEMMAPSELHEFGLVPVDLEQPRAA